MTRIRERARRKAALSDRKSSAAQARMKSIASLASDERISKKKKKVDKGCFLTWIRDQVLTTCAEDTFGANDADWAIYRKIASV